MVVCKKCNKYFSNKYSLERHQKNSYNCGNSGSKNTKINHFSVETKIYALRIFFLTS